MKRLEKIPAWLWITGILVVCLPLMEASSLKPVVLPTLTATPPPGLYLVKVVAAATFWPSLSGRQGEGSMLSLRKGESIWTDLESVGRRRAWRDSGRTQFLGWVPQELLEPPKGGWPTPTKTSAPPPTATRGILPTRTPAPPPTPTPLTGEQAVMEIIALLFLTPLIVGGGVVILWQLRYPEEEKTARRQKRAERAAAEEAQLRRIDDAERARIIEEAREEAREQAAAEHAARPD